MRRIKKIPMKVASKYGRIVLDPAKKAHRRHLRNLKAATYHDWALENEELCFVEGELSKQPLISIVVPAYNTDENHLLQMIYSIVNQHYTNWELILVNASTEAESKEKIADCAKIDNRIKVFPIENKKIASNTNEGVDRAKGEFIAFVDHDDLLHACALHCAVQAINKENADLVYSDEDKIKEDNSQYFQPFLKPGWSPDLLRNVNYINHLTVMKTEFVRKVNKLRPECDGAQDLDLLLRVIDKCQPKITHIPHVLYHWRAAATSTANDFSVKDYVLKSGTKAVQDHLDRAAIKGVASAIPARPGFYQVTYAQPKSISIVVGQVDRLKRRLCATWLEQLTDYFPHEVHVQLVIGDWYKSFIQEDSRYATTLVEGRNYWQEAAKLVKHDVVLGFQVGAIPESKEAITNLCAAANALQTIASPVLLNRGGIILDAGLVESSYGLQPLFQGNKLHDDSYYGSTEWNRNVKSLSMQVFAAPKQQFSKLVEHVEGGLNAKTIDSIYDNSSAKPLVYAHTNFIYKGSLVDDSSGVYEYFNPQLSHTWVGTDIKTTDWGDLVGVSEREHVK